MNMTLEESEGLVKGIRAALGNVHPGTKVIVCPPFTSLSAVAKLVSGSAIGLGAQNMHPESSGAFTGEISAPMLKSVGCAYVIVGHSERRQLFGESDEFINRKVQAALSAGLIPIVCVGETLEQREKGETHDVVTRQLKGCLSGVKSEDVSRCIIAYEPVWAIGTGKTATPAQAQEIHQLIRRLVASLAGKQVAESVVIQYGGSVKPENARELLTQADIDGALVGGACLKADSFAKIIASVPQAK